MNYSIKKQIINQQLQSHLNPTYLEIIDESEQHIGHAGHQGGGRHFAIKISAARLNGLSRVEAHRLIYQALGGLMRDEVHALRIEIVK